MFSDSNQESHSILKNPLFYTSTVLGVALLAVAWIMFSRWHDNREIERHAAQQRAEKQRESDLRAIQQLGGKDLEILNFSASPIQKVLSRRNDPSPSITCHSPCDSNSPASIMFVSAGPGELSDASRLLRVFLQPAPGELQSCPTLSGRLRKGFRMRSTGSTTS